MKIKEVIAMLQKFNPENDLVLSELPGIFDASEFLGEIFDVCHAENTHVELASGEKIAEATVLYFTLATPDESLEIEEYKGYRILQYQAEDGYRVDFGTKRSMELPTVEAARQLIDTTS